MAHNYIWSRNSGSINYNETIKIEANNPNASGKYYFSYKIEDPTGKIVSYFCSEELCTSSTICKLSFIPTVSGIYTIYSNGTTEPKTYQDFDTITWDITTDSREFIITPPLANTTEIITTSVMIGQASHNESGNMTGGTTGDQTGGELNTKPWYDKNWLTLFRFKDRVLAQNFANALKWFCNCGLIGYDSGSENYDSTGGRYSLYYALKELNGGLKDYRSLTKRVEADCICLVNTTLAVALAVTYEGQSSKPQDIPEYLLKSNTRNFEERLLDERCVEINELFDWHHESKYLTGISELEIGDILLTYTDSSGHAIGVIEVEKTIVKGPIITPPVDDDPIITPPMDEEVSAIKVGFLRGQSANLPIQNAKDGVFYYTIDTQRLYLGQDKELVDLNRIDWDEF